MPLNHVKKCSNCERLGSCPGCLRSGTRSELLATGHDGLRSTTSRQPEVMPADVCSTAGWRLSAAAMVGRWSNLNLAENNPVVRRAKLDETDVLSMVP